MKKTLLLILILFIGTTFVASAQEDTVGFWKIQYNGTEISPVMMNSESSYILPAVNDSDKLKIFYFTASPCSGCQCKLQFRDENGQAWKTIQRKGYGDNTPFIISGAELAPQLAKGRLYMYFSGKWDGWFPWIFMGAIRKL